MTYITYLIGSESGPLKARISEHETRAMALQALASAHTTAGWKWISSEVDVEHDAIDIAAACGNRINIYAIEPAKGA